MSKTTQNGLGLKKKEYHGKDSAGRRLSNIDEQTKLQIKFAASIKKEEKKLIPVLKLNLCVKESNCFELDNFNKSLNSELNLLS